MTCYKKRERCAEMYETDTTEVVNFVFFFPNCTFLIVVLSCFQPMTNSCLQKPCKKGFAFLDGVQWLIQVLSGILVHIRS